jgi:hypothetical protein
MKDVEANADLTSQLIKEKLIQTQQQVGIDDSTADTSRAEAAEVRTEPTKLWYEAQSDEGHVYYWHIETGGKYEGVRNFNICILLEPVMEYFLWTLSVVRINKSEKVQSNLEYSWSTNMSFVISHIVLPVVFIYC